MPTPQQFTQLVAGIRASADPTVVAALAIRNDVALAVWCNTKATPNYKIWNAATPMADTDEACDWTAFDAIQAGKRDSWGFFLSLPARDYSKGLVRKWVTDVWGAATGSNPAVAILSAGTLNATNATKIIAVAEGAQTLTTGDVSGVKVSWSGVIGVNELSDALNRNP